ncbi:carboxylesterase 1E-like [Thrips palmi]|uniref:Carboxylic ester hydrolase n=1 Tax=Thrips palmi TaxID=161013 RepID=A0A6P8Z689_THRPL|nr:carboxylesterase 1E-like [Thrips palmi]
MSVGWQVAYFTFWMAVVQQVSTTPGLWESVRQGGKSDPTVRVRGGFLRGIRGVSKSGKTFSSFLGVPYAKPPVGQLRFKGPQPADPWSGTRDATKEGSMCFQGFGTKVFRVPLVNEHGRLVTDFIKHMPPDAAQSVMEKLPGLLTGGSLADLKMGEDCLVLNVYTPQVNLPAKSLLPVLVFFHGGALVFGSGTSLMYGPDFLMDRGLVVVVPNYRLGIFGFLSSNTSDAPGNAGLKDQVQALRWVRDNIRTFGGDPSRVTIYGESAGAASVHYHILSPLSAGLFHGAILSSSAVQSGVYQSKGYDLVRRVTKFYGGPSGSPSAMVNFLRTIPGLILTATWLEVGTDQDWQQLVPNLPCRAVVEPVNGGEPAFFSEDPNDLLVAGRYNKVPMIIGSNFREGTLFFMLNTESGVDAMQRDPGILVPCPLVNVLDEAERRRVGQQIRDVYTQGRPINNETLAAVVDIFGDESLLHGIQISAAWHALRVPVYRYHFVLDAFNLLSVFLNMPPHVKVPGHGDDIGYVFRPRALGDLKVLGKRWRTGMERMLAFITNFCYHGNPTPNVTEHTPVLWPRQLKGKDVYLEFGDELTVKRDLYPERMGLLTKLYSQIIRHPVYNVPK